MVWLKFTSSSAALAANIGGDVHDIHQPNNNIGVQIAPGLQILLGIVEAYKDSEASSFEVNLNKPLKVPSIAQVITGVDGDYCSFQVSDEDIIFANGIKSYVMEAYMKSDIVASHEYVIKEESRRWDEKSRQDIEDLLGDGEIGDVGISILTAVQPLIERIKEDNDFIPRLHFPPLREGDLRVLETHIDLKMYQPTDTSMDRFFISGFLPSGITIGKGDKAIYKAIASNDAGDLYSMRMGLRFLPIDVVENRILKR